MLPVSATRTPMVASQMMMVGHQASKLPPRNMYSQCSQVPT